MDKIGIRLPYEDPNSRENVHGSYGHRDLVNLPSDSSTAETVFQIKSLDVKLNSWFSYYLYSYDGLSLVPVASNL